MDVAEVEITIITKVEEEGVTEAADDTTTVGVVAGVTTKVEGTTRAGVMRAVEEVGTRGVVAVGEEITTTEIVEIAETIIITDDDPGLIPDRHHQVSDKILFAINCDFDRFDF